MKRLLLTTSIVVLMTGCAVETATSTQAPPPPRQTTPTVADEVVDDWAFTSTVFLEYPGLDDYFTDYEMIQFGKAMCSQIDGGLTIEGLANLSIVYEIDPAMLGYIIGAAIAAYCPHNDWFFG